MSSSDNIGSNGSPVSCSPPSCSPSSSSADIDSGLSDTKDSEGGEEGRFVDFRVLFVTSSSQCPASGFPVSDVEFLDDSTI